MKSLTSLRGIYKAKILNLPKVINVNSSLSRSTAVIEDKALDENGLSKSGTERKHLTFDDPQIAYKCKSTLELLRAYTVFTLCSVSFLVDHQYKILKWTRRLIGRPLFRRLMAATVYGQFMAGEEAQSILAYIKKHKKYNVQSMLNYTALETHGFTIDSKTDVNEEELWKTNITEINNCVDLAARSLEQDLTCDNQNYATTAVKLTSLASQEAVTNMNSVIDANTNLVEDVLRPKDESGILMQCLDDIATSSTSLAQKLGLPSHSNTNNSTKWMSLLTNQAFHLAAMQSEDLAILAKERGHTLAQPMSQKEVDQIITLFHWMSESAQKAEVSMVRIAVDAEQSYLQLALDLLTLDLMRRFNTKRPVILNTYQCYRTRTHDIVVRDLQIAQDEDFTHGSKVVRGGYMDEERKLVTEHGYPDPINPNYEATTAMYYKVAEELLQRVQSDSSGKKVQILFATHNEDTVKHIANRMYERNMTPDGNTVLFGQLMGMRDHISFSLGHAGLPAAKMLHYGPIDQGMAYLSRRVTENRGGIETADKEREIVKREIFRRVKTRELRHNNA